MTVARLDAELGPDELSYWEAYFSVQPMPRADAWLRNALLRAAVLGGETRFKDLMPPDLWSDDDHT